MKTIKLNFILLTLAGVVAACSSTGIYDTAEYRLPDGSTVELTETLKLPYQSARTYIQGGESLRWSEVDHYLPFCSFGLDRSRDGKPLVDEIPPTRFTTGKFQIGVEARAEQGKPVQVASSDASVFLLAGRATASMESGGSPWPYRYYTRIELYSEDVPQVDDLTCAYDGEPTDHNLSLAQIRDTLGELVRIY